MPILEETANELNPEQKKAVIFDKGPLLIIAGAGTGKTTVIARRIAHLIASKKAKPSEILALTFTDKAADEMETRVDKLVPYGYVDVSISTFHAFGDRVLRDYALDLGLRPDYRVLSSAEQAVFMREHIFELPLKHYISLGDPIKHVDALLRVISRAKDEDITPERWIKNEGEEKELEVAKVYKKYQELKYKNGFLDFGDQVSLTLNLFRKHPSILRKFQKQYKYVLVDEFQDTNYAQFELLKLLVKKHKNITVVGDDDQSIYKFRGAAISNILSFEKTYKKTKKVVLTKNYRSSQIILDAAYRLIQHNNPDRLEVRSKIDKKLIAANPPKETKTENKNFDSIYSEADWVAQTIKEKYESGKFKLSDFAILIRSNAQAEPFQQSLNMAGLANQSGGGGGLYQLPEVRMAISFLRVIGDLADSVSLYDLACSELYSLDALELQKLNTFASRRNYTLHHVFTHLEDPSEEYKVLADIKVETRETIKNIMIDIAEYINYAKDHSTGEVLYLFFKKTGYLKRLNEINDPESEDKIKNLAQFFEKIREFHEVAKVDKVAEFVKYLNILRESGDDPASSRPDFDQDVVNILTVHKAKGLEFPVVFVTCLVADKFPARKRKDPIELPEKLIKDSLPKGDFHLQEERRLFYVAMTRAKSELYLTSSLNYGGKRTCKVSQFVLEALDMPKADVETIKRSAMEQIELFAPLPRNLSRKKRKEGVMSLSFYHINDYLSCPLKYKYVHILRVPLLPNHQIIYGSALHKAVQAYLVSKKNHQKFSAKDLEQVFLNNWSSEGFISREHEERRLESGKKALAGFYKREEKLGHVPFYVEEGFSINQDNIRVRGRFDRVDKRDGKVFIIDFKSSDVRDQEKADKKAKENMQLSIYALAWQHMFSKIPDRVELHFLDTGLIGSVEKKQKNLDKTWEKVQKVAEGLRSENYKAAPSSFTCQYCAYSEVCPESMA
ncbi:MAG: ATP-dependent helicase [Candidatus Saganbacteria bacterium]|nr:ATP-dependent helicase [Candidatus Saganbacteria bacterium]